MPKFEHFLITRFNVPLPWASSQWDNAWLEKRIPLFEDFCFPSVRSQKNRNFKWLVLFDSKSPPFLKEYVREKQNLDFFIPVFVEHFDRFVLRPIVFRMLSADTEYLITSRLDNDDAIASDFVGTVQDSFACQQRSFLNLSSGYWWHEGKIYRKTYPTNPFVSLVEKVRWSEQKPILTVFTCDHTKIAEVGEVVDIDCPPAWMVVVHEGNLANRRQGLRQPLKKLRGRFGISPKYLAKNESYLLCVCSMLKWKFGRLVSAVRTYMAPRIRIFLEKNKP